MLQIGKLLEKHISNALKQSFPELLSSEQYREQDLDPQIVPASKPEFGDFQANCALGLAKRLKKSPREIAEAIVIQLKNNDEFLNVCEVPFVAGPGFINLIVKNDFLTFEIKNRLQDKRLGVPMINRGGEENKDVPIVLVDFSSPNIAKEMHVGHLRSTIIGDSLARVLEFRGYKVIRLNHVGDWGTQFGMLITHLKNIAPDALLKPSSIDLGDLVKFYRQAKKEFDSNEEFRDLSRKEVVRLQKGEANSLKGWQLLCEQSRKEFQKIYDRLDIQITERGESFYNRYLNDVVHDLLTSNLLVTDDGAKCVFLKGMKNKSGKPLPLIIQKSDGGFNYATTDLAAIRYRFTNPPQGDGASRLIYVTDSGQANHFAGVFQVAKRANWIPDGCSVEHVPFGLVQGKDGKKLKTRAGDTVRLKDLLDEAIDRAKSDLERRLQEEDRQENQQFIETVSTKIGIAAVKYADLSQNRITNYQFSFDRMLALQGNTAPYLLYALVRISGISRKGGEFEIDLDKLQFKDSHELILARELLKFEDVILDVEKELLPNRLCTYLFELSQIFNRFYDQVPILRANEPLRSNRLALCRITAETLKLGLTLLGIPTLERM
tara:strand:+ start:1766 stop:3580 length:1815 start_codon:yes stop_codon:yes gene_type:complete